MSRQIQVRYTNTEGTGYMLDLDVDPEGKEAIERMLDQDFDTYGGPVLMTIEHRDGSIEKYRVMS